MKLGSGMRDRDDKSTGIEILMADPFTKIKPTEPLRLAKQITRRNQNLKKIDPIPHPTVVH